MPKLTVITDSNNKVLGTVRSDPVETGAGTQQFQAPVSDKQVFREIDAKEELLSLAPDQLHAEVAKLIHRP